MASCACARRQGPHARLTVCGGCWWCLPLVSVVLWLLVGHDVAVVDDRHRALVRNARAFGPGGWWCGGMPFVLSDRRHGRRGARLWPLAGRCLVVPRDQCHALLRDVGSSLVVGSQPGGGVCPLNVVGGSIPSCRYVDVGWYGGAYAVPLSCVSMTLGPWGLLATWRGVASVPSFALGVAMCGCGGSGVVACTGCENCITCLCVMLGAWLCRRDDGGGGACPWALVVVGGMCPVIV